MVLLGGSEVVVVYRQFRGLKNFWKCDQVEWAKSLISEFEPHGLGNNF